MCVPEGQNTTFFRFFSFRDRVSGTHWYYWFSLVLRWQGSTWLCHPVLGWLACAPLCPAFDMILSIVLRSSCHATSILPTEWSLQPQIQRLLVNFILLQTSFSHWEQKRIYFGFHTLFLRVRHSLPVVPCGHSADCVPCLIECGDQERAKSLPLRDSPQESGGGAKWSGNMTACDNRHREAKPAWSQKDEQWGLWTGAGGYGERSSHSPEKFSGSSKHRSLRSAWQGKPQGVLNVIEWSLWLLSGEQILDGTRRMQAS